MNATAVAHPNIALVKYWGKRDLELNLPAAGSLSVTLKGLSTTTTVEFDSSQSTDVVILDGSELQPGRPRRRVVEFLDLVRDAADIDTSVRVETANDFPTASGLASSASGFAALAVAAADAAGLHWSDEQLSVLARRGSGSAARSIYGGFVEMQPGSAADGSDAHATPIADSDHWDLRCLVAVTDAGTKDIGSTEGMLRTQQTSPLFEPWRATVADDIAQARNAIEHRDFNRLGKIAERSCFRMHATALGADPAILYWNATTTRLIHAIRAARSDGLACFLSIDAGPHVKVFCPSADADEVRTILEETSGVVDVLSTRPGRGARRCTTPTSTASTG